MRRSYRGSRDGPCLPGGWARGRRSWHRVNRVPSLAMRRLPVVLVLIVLTAGLVGISHASAQFEFDVRGTWRWMRWELSRPTNVKDRGGYGGTLVLATQDPVTGEVTGTLRNGGSYQVTG